jgi:hypothetical protein
MKSLQRGRNVANSGTRYVGQSIASRNEAPKGLSCACFRTDEVSIKLSLGYLISRRSLLDKDMRRIIHENLVRKDTGFSWTYRGQLLPSIEKEFFNEAEAKVKWRESSRPG